MRIYHTCFILCIIDRYLGNFQFLTLMSTIPMNILANVSFGECIYAFLFGVSVKNGLADLALVEITK